MELALRLLAGLAFLLLVACSLRAELEPGVYVCTARAPGYEDLEPIRVDSEKAYARVTYGARTPYPGVVAGISFTDTLGRRQTLATDSAPGWWCEKEETRGHVAPR